MVIFMARQSFNAYVFLYRQKDNVFEFALFHRKDNDTWQGISGGGEDKETPIQAAIREVSEEAGAKLSNLFSLDTLGCTPVTIFRDRALWNDDVFIVPFHFFAAYYDGSITISDEHNRFGWFDYKIAYDLLFWHDNKTALWELNERLLKNKMSSI